MGLMAVLLVSALASAHPGGVGADGCHADKRTGERHCHGAQAAPTQAHPPAKRVETCAVLRVSDGDTFQAVCSSAAVTVRLDGIDCPEGSQPGGAEATAAARELLDGATVVIRIAGQDRYGRDLAEVLLPDDRILNRVMVRQGWAWWFRQYSKDETLAALEQQARAAGRGIWAAGEPTAPWDWRKARR